MKVKNKQKVRLPEHIVPERYKIRLEPDLEAFVFVGEETISLIIDKPIRNITLHSRELDIESAEIIKGKEKIFALKISYDEKAETATFIFPKLIPKGKIELKLIFRGVLNDKMRGFYRSSYKIGDKTHHVATTQFESTDARRAFPCFDEPAAKAVFDVELIVPEESTAISNTVPTEILEHRSGYRLVRFAPTPKMSTYLLAFIVGKFEYIEKKTKEGVLVRVFSTPGKKHQTKFALDSAVKSLSFFEKYFDIKYPLPVLDLIAVPDFAAGAMENWGAITYRESALLVDSEHSAAANKQWVALVIAHEIAHQWFGNLVTMEWWTHLWLNEGFASYLEYLAVDHVFPKWNIWTQFAYGDLGVAFELDALKNTHPIEIPVHHSDEISEIFDSVSYSKGASIIRMLAGYIGEKNLRDGLRHYLKKHSYGNTSTEDLWRAFEKVSGKPVLKIMKNWTAKAGHPLLSISEKKGGFLAEQSRFFLSPISAQKTKDKTSWSIPVSVMSQGMKRPAQFLMEKKKQFLKIPGVRAGEWIKFNIGESGFFRTRYPASFLTAQEKAVIAKKFSALDRLGLLRDIISLAEAGKGSTAGALEFARGYRGETDYTVWLELSSDLGKISSLISHEPFAQKYDEFCRQIFAPIGKKLGWDANPGEPHTEALLRSLALGNLGSYGDRATIARARNLFSRIKKGKNPIPADLRGVVYNTVARHGGDKEYVAFMDMYDSVALSEEKNRAGRALGRFHNKRLLKKTLDFAISKKVRVQDTISIVASVFANDTGREIAWEFVKKHWPFFLERYGGAHALSNLISCAGVFTSPSKAKDVEKFFKRNSAPGAERTISQVLERIYINAAWLKRDGKSIAKLVA